MTTIQELNNYLKYAELANGVYAFESIYEKIKPNTNGKYFSLNEILFKENNFSINQANAFAYVIERNPDGSPKLNANNEVNVLSDGLYDFKFEYKNKNDEKLYAQSSYEYFKAKNYIGSPSGFKAAIFKDRITNKYILSIAGTDGISNDLFTDAQLFFDTISNQFPYLVDYINYVKSILPIGEKITITGHSLGGALAQMATAIYPECMEERD